MTTTIVRPGRTLHNRQHVIEDVEWIIGTDHPRSIAHRLGYASLDSLLDNLRRWGRGDLARRLVAQMDNDFDRPGRGRGRRAAA